MLLPQIARLYGVTVDDLYRQDSNAYPNYAQRLLSVYEATRRTEDFLAAEQEFVRLMATDHTADDLRSFGVLYHYMLRKCAARAKEYLDAAIEQADKSQWFYSSACQQRIALLCDLGRGEEEAQRLDRERLNSPDDPMAWLLCVAAHDYAGLTQKAYALAVAAADRFPENPALHVHAGNICRDMGRYDEAFAYWRKVLQLDRSYMDAAYSIAGCYEQLGQFREALEAWENLHRQLLAGGFVHESQYTVERIQFCEGKLGK